MPRHPEYPGLPVSQVIYAAVERADGIKVFQGQRFRNLSRHESVIRGDAALIRLAPDFFPLPAAGAQPEFLQVGGIHQAVVKPLRAEYMVVMPVGKDQFKGLVRQRTEI